MGAEAERLARHLASIDDEGLRTRKAAAVLAQLPSDAAVQLLCELVRAAGAARSGSAEAVEALQRALRFVLDQSLRDDLLAAAREAGAGEAEALLTQAAPARSFDSGEPGYVDREMTARTLGHRRSIARGQDRDLLSRLVHDQDPVVVRHLLENPKITEREVLVAASRRPTHAAVLEEVFRSPRFSSNRRVRKALALNPYSPPALAAAALSLLTGPDLREVARDESVRPEVREHAARLLALRGGVTLP